MGSGFPENFPFADIDRMISDAFEVFGQHQGIEALYRIGTIFFYVDNDIILYLIKKLVDDIIGSDDIIRFFLIPGDKGADCLVYHLPEAAIIGCRCPE